jgi:hypothetical protein
MQINLYGLAHHEPELTHAQLTAYLKQAEWFTVKEISPHWRILQQPAACKGLMDCQTIWLPDTPDAPTPRGIGLSQWGAVFTSAIETLATCEGKRAEDVSVPYRVLRVLGSRRLGAADQQPGAFTTFFPYFTLLDLELPTGLPASENVTLRDVLGHAAFQHWELLEPEAAATWSRSWKAHLETAQRGYAVWLEKVQ